MCVSKPLRNLAPECNKICSKLKIIVRHFFPPPCYKRVLQLEGEAPLARCEGACVCVCLVWPWDVCRIFAPNWRTSVHAIHLVFYVVSSSDAAIALEYMSGDTGIRSLSPIFTSERHPLPMGEALVRALTHPLNFVRASR